MYTRRISLLTMRSVQYWCIIKIDLKATIINIVLYKKKNDFEISLKSSQLKLYFYEIEDIQTPIYYIFRFLLVCRAF